MKVKKYIAIGMMVVLVFCLGGCVKIGKNNPHNKVVAYMNQKYPSDTFTYKEAVGAAFGQPTTDYYVNSANYPTPIGDNINNEICVTYYVDEKGQEIYYDNYLAVKYYDQTIALYEEVLEEVFPGQEYSIHTYVGTGPICKYTGSDNMTFEEFISDSTNNVCIGVTFEDGSFDWDDKSEREIIEEHMLNRLTARNMCISARIDMRTDDGWVDFNFDMESLGEFSWVSWQLNHREMENN